jgi:hypothetical protein
MIKNSLFQSKNIQYFLILGISLIGIFPYLFLFQYSFPIMDDYVYSFRINNYGFWETQKIWYTLWTGRYSGTVLLSFLTASFKFYSLFLFLINILIVFSFSISLKYLFQISLKNSSLISLFTFCYITNTLPNIQEGLYWLASSAMYLFPLAIVPLFLILLQKSITSIKRKKLLYSLFAAITLFIIIGFNEPLSIILLINLSIFILVYQLSLKKIDYTLLIILIAGIFGFLLLALAPGNGVRKSEIVYNAQLIQTIFYSVYTSVYQIFNWLIFTPILLLCFICHLIFKDEKFYQNIISSNVLKIPFKWNIVQLVLSIMACNFTIFYSVGTPPPGRMLNIMYIYFLIMFFIIFQKIFQTFNTTIKINSKQYSLVLLLLISSFFIGSSNYQNGIYDILSNNAHEYHKEMEARANLLMAHKGKKYYLPPLESTPKSLFKIDINSDFTNWHNQMLGNYYGIDTLILKQAK